MNWQRTNKRSKFNYKFNISFGVRPLNPILQLFFLHRAFCSICCLFVRVLFDDKNHWTILLYSFRQASRSITLPSQFTCAPTVAYKLHCSNVSKSRTSKRCCFHSLCKAMQFSPSLFAAFFVVVVVRDCIICFFFCFMWVRKFRTSDWSIRCVWCWRTISVRYARKQQIIFSSCVHFDEDKNNEQKNNEFMPPFSLT